MNTELKKERHFSRSNLLFLKDKRGKQINAQRIAQGETPANISIKKR